VQRAESNVVVIPEPPRFIEAESDCVCRILNAATQAARSASAMDGASKSMSEAFNKSKWIPAPSSMGPTIDPE